jgi:hypothetical protein
MGIIVRNGISYGGTGTVDPILDQRSSNPVENKAVAKAISDISTIINEIDNSVKYSYDEQAVGTWVDGSTIYKRTFHTGQITAGNAITIQNDFNAAWILNYESFTQYQDSVYDFRFAGPVGNDRCLTQVYIDAINGAITYDPHNSNPYTDSYLTIWYVKSS